jgi:hypothetical protein
VQSSCRCPERPPCTRVMSRDSSILVVEISPCVFDLSAGPSGLVTPFQMIPVPNASTGSLVFVDLIPPVAVVAARTGDILIDFDASTVLTPPVGSVSFDGANFQFLWDGAPLVDTGFYELDPGVAGTGFDSMGIPVRFRSRVVGATAGPHTLAVQWNVNVLGDLVSSFLGSGNLTIQTAPP